MNQDSTNAQGGKIGIFWHVNGELIFKANATSEVSPVEGIRDTDDDHFSYWDHLVTTKRKDLVMYSYDHFPRGRIVYRDRDKKYVIYGDRCVIFDKKFINRLCDAFCLSPRRCVILSDEHYQCHRCNPFFVPDTSISDK